MRMTFSSCLAETLEDMLKKTLQAKRESKENNYEYFVIPAFKVTRNLISEGVSAFDVIRS